MNNIYGYGLVKSKVQTFQIPDKNVEESKVDEQGSQLEYTRLLSPKQKRQWSTASQQNAIQLQQQLNQIYIDNNNEIDSQIKSKKVKKLPSETAWESYAKLSSINQQKQQILNRVKQLERDEKNTWNKINSTQLEEQKLNLLKLQNVIRIKHKKLESLEKQETLKVLQQVNYQTKKQFQSRLASIYEDTVMQKRQIKSEIKQMTENKLQAIQQEQIVSNRSKSLMTRERIHQSQQKLKEYWGTKYNRYALEHSLVSHKHAREAESVQQEVKVLERKEVGLVKKLQMSTKIQNNAIGRLSNLITIEDREFGGDTFYKAKKSMSDGRFEARSRVLLKTAKDKPIPVSAMGNYEESQDMIDKERRRLRQIRILQQKEWQHKLSKINHKAVLKYI